MVKFLRTLTIPCGAMVARLAVNEKVRGSNPRGGAELVLIDPIF